MTTLNLAAFKESYAAALRLYLAQRDEESLALAYEMGREAFRAHVSVIDIVGIHFSVLEEALPQAPGPEAQRELISRAAEFLSEALSIDEITRASFQEAAETSARLMQLATTIAHEFRTPLTYIMMSAGLLREELPPDTPDSTRKLVDHIAGGAELLKTQTDDLLDVVSFKMGGVRVDLAPLDAKPFLEESLDRLRRVVERSGLAFQSTVPDEIPRIQGDRRRLDQVLSNLVNNAVKYGFSGGRVEVKVSLEDALVIDVRDYGPGLPPEDQRRLFQPFFRADRHRRMSGLGVGLSLVKEIVQAHHGAISVWSEEGKGTLFRVQIPFEETQARSGIS